jgi:hypothetical protein
VNQKEVVEILTQPGLEIILTYAPAGLGHLRDMDALKDGIPNGVKSSVLYSGDEAIRVIHRLTSVNPFMRGVFEYMQSGLAQTIFTHFYRNYLRSHVKEVKEDLLLQINNTHPKKLIIVATHFGFAHQVAAIKKEVEVKTGCKIYLIVQVTDDSPQYIWHVDGADLTFVTSEYVRKGLLEYSHKRRVPELKMEINSTPLHPILSIPLSKTELNNRIDQANPDSEVKIHVVVPISGAAVGTDYVLNLMKKLHESSPRFIFHVVTKIAPFTTSFLNELKNMNYVKVYASDRDKDVVDLYDDVLKDHVVLLEITKPSEQAFKAALDPTSRGGVLMLFQKPVGRQEYENINYLIRRNLMPSVEENNLLWSEALQGKEYFEKTNNLEAGVSIPYTPDSAAEFIMWCLNKKIFSKMLQSDRREKRLAFPDEISDDSTGMFWEKVAKFIASN